MRKICKVIDTLSAAVAKVSFVACFLLVLLTFEQVVSRYFFNSSSVAMQELEWHMFGLIFLLAAPYTLLKDGHVRIDIFRPKLSKNAQRLIDIVGIICFLIPVCLLLIYYGIHFVEQSLETANLRPSDYYSSYYFSKDSVLYSIISPIEELLRKTILVGEISPDPGGLEARWIIKAAIPFAFFLMLLQGISLLIKNLLGETFASKDNIKSGI
ncbi:MAG: TRAP transporter small permease subunit [Candidatus Dadabacteria bacterium]|nr:MAG: TRAP transporter small permease subunit [Candidatus Dadabacteria bacterium]